MATKRTRTTAKPKANTSSLLAALEFISLAQQTAGDIQQTHCVISGGWAAASNRLLTMAHKVPDELGTCPHTHRLMGALRRCSGSVSITQLEANRIAVKSEALRVVVPCVEKEQLSIVWADPRCGDLGQAFLSACASICHLATDGGSDVRLCSILCRGGTVCATSSGVLAEAWHGFETPPYWVIPKPTITALLKIAKPITGLGFTDNSATFFFGEDAWLKTQLYENAWPTLDKLFEQAPKQVTPVPATLFAALDVLNDFMPTTGRVEFKDELIKAVTFESEQAEHTVAGLKEGPIFGMKDLQAIKKIALTLDYSREAKNAIFTGTGLRGVVGTDGRSYVLPEEDSNEGPF